MEKRGISRGDIIKTAIFGAILLGVTVLALDGLFGSEDNLNNMLDVLDQSSDHHLIPLMIGVPIVWIASDAFVVWQLTRRTSPNYKYRQALSSVGWYIIFSLLTPFQSGGQVFQVLYMKKQGVKYSSAISATIISAVMFQLITVPVSTGLFAYANINPFDYYRGFKLLDFTFLGFDGETLAFVGTLIALAVNLVAMSIPIIISYSKKALSVIAVMLAKIGCQRPKKTKHAKTHLVLWTTLASLATIAILMRMFIPPLKAPLKEMWFEVINLNRIWLFTMVLSTIMVFKFGLRSSKKRYEKYKKSYIKKMEAYRLNFRETISNKKVFIMCLGAMLIKEINHSMSIVYAADMIHAVKTTAAEGMSWFDLAITKNILTLAQTVVPTPGGSGGAEVFYKAGALSFYNEADASVIAFVTRISTFWAVLLWAVIFRIVFSAKRKGLGAEVASHDMRKFEKMKQQTEDMLDHQWSKMVKKSRREVIHGKKKKKK